jgi:hypothetical protein
MTAPVPETNTRHNRQKVAQSEYKLSLVNKRPSSLAHDALNSATPNYYTPIIDCDLLEASKENIQPLASGRSATALSIVLSTPHAQQEAQHHSTKARHHINIQISLNDDDLKSDPLEAYTSFVNWTLEAYPQRRQAARRSYLRSEGRQRWEMEGRVEISEVVGAL